MILKYRTTSLSSPPHSSFSYIDNISHITPSYNPSNSTLTLHLTFRTPIPSSIPSFYPFPYPIPTTIVLNDLAFLLTDEGKILDKLFVPTSKTHYPTYSDETVHSPNHSPTHPKSYHSYKPYRHNHSNPSYPNSNYPNNKKEEPDT